MDFPNPTAKITTAENTTSESSQNVYKDAYITLMIQKTARTWMLCDRDRNSDLVWWRMRQSFEQFLNFELWKILTYIKYWNHCGRVREKRYIVLSWICNCNNLSELTDIPKIIMKDNCSILAVAPCIQDFLSHWQRFSHSGLDGKT